MLAFGLVGILFRLAQYPLAPIVIGGILGPLLENNYRKSLLLTDDGLLIFLQRPVALVLLIANVIMIASSLWFALKHKEEDDGKKSSVPELDEC